MSYAQFYQALLYWGTDSRKGIHQIAELVTGSAKPTPNVCMAWGKRTNGVCIYMFKYLKVLYQANKLN